MTDIPDTLLFAYLISTLAIWIVAFSFGKLAGRQKAEARYRLQRQALAASRKRNIER